ncbi:MAG: sigma-70 family RNA polymerase sigma factor [Caulobacteraceae bacterium]
MNAIVAWPVQGSRVHPRGAALVTGRGDDGADSLVVRRILAIAERSDRQAFAALFLEFGPRVKAFLVRRGVEAPDEVTQEVMLSVWRRAGTFDPSRGAGEAWIFGIARNACIDAARRRRRAPLVDLDPLADRAEPPRGDHELQAAEDSRRVRAAMAALSPEQVQVVRLSFFEDEPHSEIAARLGLPLGTVKSRLRLAMKRLRDLMGDPS